MAKKENDCMCLLSGGLDSWILANKLKKEGKTPLAVIFNWGQVNKEFKKAISQAKELDLYYKTVKLPKMKSVGEVPYRNLILLSHSCKIAKEKGISDVYIAVHKPATRKEDRYYDCTPEFIDGLSKLTDPEGIEVKAPFVNEDLTEILTRNRSLEYPNSIQICNSHRYNCGRCDKCMDVLSAIYISKIEHNIKFARTPFTEPDIVGPMKNYPCWFEARYYHNDRCNLNCGFCYYGWEKEECEEVYPIYNKINIVKKIRELGIRRIMFSGREPLIDGEVFQLIEKFGEIGGTSEINTNGTKIMRFFDEIKRECRKGHLKRILISEHPGIVEKVKRLTEIKGLIAQPYLVVNKDNKDRLKEKVKELYGSGARKFYIRPMMARGKKGSRLKDLELNLEEERELIEEITSLNLGLDIEFPVQRNPEEVPWLDIDYENFNFVKRIGNNKITYAFLHNRCLAYWLSITVLPDGDVIGCAKESYLPLEKIREKYVVGNILDDRPEELRKKIQEKIGEFSYCL